MTKNLSKPYKNISHKLKKKNIFSKVRARHRVFREVEVVLNTLQVARVSLNLLLQDISSSL